MNTAINKLETHEQHCALCRDRKGGADEAGHCERGALLYRVACAVSAPPKRKPRPPRAVWR